jgi:hypothetical protein
VWRVNEHGPSRVLSDIIREDPPVTKTIQERQEIKRPVGRRTQFMEALFRPSG